jgi:hypothetical protein
MYSTGSVRRRLDYGARPLLLLVHEKCQGKTAIGSRAVYRLEAVLLM